MKIIKYIQLFNYLISEEGFKPVYVYHTIQKIRQLPAELKDAVLDTLEGVMPNVEYHEVTLEELIEKDKMEPIRAILMLDWIRREPAVAMRYMERERYRAPQTITDSDKEMLEQVLDKLNAKEKEDSAENVEDIIIEEK